MNRIYYLQIYHLRFSQREIINFQNRTIQQGTSGQQPAVKFPHPVSSIKNRASRIEHPACQCYPIPEGSRKNMNCIYNLRIYHLRFGQREIIIVQNLTIQQGTSGQQPVSKFPHPVSRIQNRVSRIPYPVSGIPYQEYGILSISCMKKKLIMPLIFCWLSITNHRFFNFVVRIKMK